MSVRKKLPFEKVKIGYADFDLYPKDTDRRSVDDTNHGEIHFAKQAIHYDPTVHRQELANTLLHEVLHGLNYIMNYKQDEEEEESFTRFYTNALLTLIRDNPDFFRWVIEQVTDEN